MLPLLIAFLCVTNGLAAFKIHEPTNSVRTVVNVNFMKDF